MAENEGVLTEVAKNFIVAKTAVAVWSTVISSLLSLLLLLGLFSSMTRPDPVVAVGLLGLYGVYSQRRDTTQFTLLMVWVSFLVDVLWASLLGPLHLTKGQILSAVSSNCWRETGDVLCYADRLGANISLTGVSLETSLTAVMLVVKLVLIFLLPGLLTALQARHGSTQVHQLAGVNKAAASLANQATFASKLVIFFGAITLLLRKGADVSILPALLVLTGALERRRDLLGIAIPYLLLSYAYDVYWLLTDGLVGTSISADLASGRLPDVSELDLAKLSSRVSVLSLLGTCATLLDGSLKLVLLGYVLLLLSIKGARWSTPPFVSSSALPGWLKAEEDANHAGALHDDDVEDVDALMTKAERTEKFWSAAAAALAHLLLPVSLVTVLMRSNSTPLVAGWIIFCTGLRDCKLIDASSSLKRGALSTALGLVVACLCTDVLWLLEFADARYFSTAVSEVQAAVATAQQGNVTAQQEAFMAIDPLQVTTVACTLVAGVLEALLVPTLLKGYSTVRFPPAQQLAWQKQAEAEWIGRCITVLLANFAIAFATSSLAVASDLWHGTASLVLPVLSCWAVSRAKSAASPVYVCCVLMLLGPVADVGWLLVGQGVSVHQFVLMLHGQLELVNGLDETRRLLLIGAAGSLLTTLVAVLFMLILKATVVPRKTAAPPKCCATHLLKSLTTLLLVLGILSSFESFAPSLVVAAVGLIAASTLADGADLPPEDHFILWLFSFSGAATLFAQALWVLWFGRGPHLLKLASAYAEGEGEAYVVAEASVVSHFAAEVVAEISSGEAATMAGASAASTFGELLHVSLTALSFLVLSASLCLSAGLQTSAALRAGGVSPPASAGASAPAMV